MKLVGIQIYIIIIIIIIIVMRCSVFLFLKIFGSVSEHKLINKHLSSKLQSYF